MLPWAGTSLGMLPRASLFKPRRLWKLVIAAKTTGLCPMQEVKPEWTNPQQSILSGDKKCPNLVNDLLLRCEVKCVTSEGPALPLCLLTISSLSCYVIEREKTPLFCPAVIWDALRAQYTEDTGSVSRLLPSNLRTRLFTSQRISLSFKNNLKNQLESGNHLIV